MCYLLMWTIREATFNYPLMRHFVKLDGVAPLMTDPPPINSTTLSEKNIKKKLKKNKNKK